MSDDGLSHSIPEIKRIIEEKMMEVFLKPNTPI
jgi:hypothetical protein